MSSDCPKIRRTIDPSNEPVLAEFTGAADALARLLAAGCRVPSCARDCHSPLSGGPRMHHELSLASSRIQHAVSYPSFADSLDFLSNEAGPPIVHDFRLTHACTSSCTHCGGMGCTPAPVVARLVVNEFPLHFPKEDSSWFWRFDMCPLGPSEPLGAMLDEMLASGRLWGEEPTAGSVFHLQQLELDPAQDPQELVAGFLRIVLWLLSRSQKDLAIAETRPVNAPLPPLWPMDRERFDAMATIFEQGLLRTGFRPYVAHESHVVADAMRRQFDMSRESAGTSYYKKVRRDATFFDEHHGVFDDDSE